MSWHAGAWPYFAALLPLGGVALGAWGAYAFRVAEERRRAKLQTYFRLAGLAHRESQLQLFRLRAVLAQVYWRVALVTLDEGQEDARRWVRTQEEVESNATWRLMELRGDVLETLTAVKLLFKGADVSAAADAVAAIARVEANWDDPEIGAEALNHWRPGADAAILQDVEQKVNAPYAALLAMLAAKVPK